MDTASQVLMLWKRTELIGLQGLAAETARPGPPGDWPAFEPQLGAICEALTGAPEPNQSPREEYEQLRSMILDLLRNAHRVPAKQLDRLLHVLRLRLLAAHQQASPDTWDAFYRGASPVRRPVGRAARMGRRLTGTTAPG